MSARIIRESGDGRVLLLKRGRAYSVEIAGGEYGPYNWRDACETYRRHAVKPLRSYTFRPYRPGMGPHFILTTFDPDKRDHKGKSVLGYRLTMRDNGKSVALFKGEDFGCSPMHAIDSVAAAEGLMGFLTLRPGDTDAEYFKDYTPEQLAYCSTHAQALSGEVSARWHDPATGNLKKRYQ
jgi:hypothetical protein